MSRSLLPEMTFIHPLVDACSISVLMIGGDTSWERVIAYNALAFALQLPFGIVLDRWPRWTQTGFIVGVGLVLVAAFASIVGLCGWLPLTAVCVGNALFHLSAGKHILDFFHGNGGPIGMFISTGALGLLAGRMGTERFASIGLLVFSAALAAAVLFVVVWLARCPVAFCVNATAAVCRDCRAFVPSVLLALLFLLVVWRSWAWLSAWRLTIETGALLIILGTVAAFCGKASGGYVADRIGCWTVTAISICGSLAMVFLCSPESPMAWIALLFVSQLATGPVLSLLYDNAPRADCGGTAFGINCLGLFVGSL